MIERYFFAHDGTESGPFTAGEMRGHAVAGRIVLTDTVWRGAAGQRVLAAKVKNLFAIPQLPARSPGTGLPTTHLDHAPTQTASASLPAMAVAPPPADPGPVTPLPFQAVLGSLTAGPVVGTAALPVAEKPKADTAHRAAQPAHRPKRVVSIKGGVLLGQDGVEVKFKKKCADCGHEDASRSTARIVVGSTKVPFFCPKCKRMRSVEIRGVG